MLCIAVIPKQYRMNAGHARLSYYLSITRLCESDLVNISSAWTLTFHTAANITARDFTVRMVKISHWVLGIQKILSAEIPPSSSEMTIWMASSRVDFFVFAVNSISRLTFVFQGLCLMCRWDDDFIICWLWYIPKGSYQSCFLADVCDLIPQIKPAPIIFKARSRKTLWGICLCRWGVSPGGQCSQVSRQSSSISF